MSQSGPPPLFRANAFVWAVVVVFAFFMATFVVGALRKPEMPQLAITPPNPVPVGDTLVGPAIVTLDATDENRWTYFDFSRNSAVERPGPLDWDLAVSRFHVIANGGDGFGGRGGIVNLGSVPFDSVVTLPDTGYVATARDSTSAGVGKWYRYGWSSHLLTPKGDVYGVRTADGRYAKVTIVSYYCAGAQGGCLTIRYAYQGDGTRRVAR
ncbi:MAG: HmuY family protein [Gemmatimonadales bacterium]|nr:HmuY family protein [Gemmatimonadales bacterium]